ESGAAAPAEGHSNHGARPTQLVSATTPQATAPHATAASAEPVSAANREIVQRNTAARIGMGLLGVRVDKLESPPGPLTGGMSGYLLPFEIVSVHLLVVLIGAAYLARTKKRAGRV
ncbi:MAG TPA: hypothetical protein VIK18_23550, partial [Pirellulales bacterium]